MNIPEKKYCTVIHKHSVLKTYTLGAAFWLCLVDYKHNKSKNTVKGALIFLTEGDALNLKAGNVFVL